MVSVMNANSTGVLSESEILLVRMIQGKRALRSIFIPPDLDELNELLAFLWEEELSSIWIMPGTSLSGRATCSWLEQARENWVILTHASPSEPARPSCAILWPRGVGRQEARRLTLVFPEHAGWNWSLSDAKSLLATVTYLEQGLARLVIDSPELFAHRLLSDLTRDRPASWFHSSPESLHALLRSGQIARPLMEAGREQVWARPLTLAELRQRYLHKYTHLSWSLEACLTLQLGAGVLEYSPNGRAYDAQRPGIWRIQAERAGSVFDTAHLPSCMENEWMSTPQVKCCQDIGYHVHALEGYSWSQAYPLLKPWAETLWQAASRFCTHPDTYRHTQGRANGLRTIKSLAHLGMSILAQEKSSGGWYRPDWWATLMGGGKAILFAHLARLARRGVMPALIGKDAIWAVSDDPNPLTAIPGLVSSRRWTGYMVGYDVPLALSREVKAAFRMSEHPDQVALALDTCAGS